MSEREFSELLDAYGTVCSRAARLLQMLRPWAMNGAEINTACVELTLALALVPDVEAARETGRS